VGVTMQFYKKVFLTFVGAGTLSSCALQKNVTTPVTATVVNITDYFYLDQNADGAVDNCLYIKGDTEKNEQCYFYDYIQIGDTLKYRTSNKRLVNLNANGACPNVFLDSVNDRSVDDLMRLYKLKYKTFGQSKVK
jgi:hypothetical protein